MRSLRSETVDEPPPPFAWPNLRSLLWRRPKVGVAEVPCGFARLAPFSALVAGAAAIGISPISVRLADVGPFASAFWRVTLGPPLLWILGTEVAGMWA